MGNNYKIDLRDMKVFILAGGLGTRLRTVISDRPKPMALVQGKPILEYVMRHFAAWGVSKFILSVGYLSDQVLEYFGDGKRFGWQVEYSVEKDLLGTGGALVNARKLLSEPCLVTNGDTLTQVDLAEFVGFHGKKNADWSIVVRKSEGAIKDPMGTFETNDDGQVLGIDGQKTKGRGDHLNAGIYCISPKSLDGIELKAPFSLEKDLFPELLRQKKRIFLFETKGFFFDIGTPEKYRELCEKGVPKEMIKAKM